MDETLSNLHDTDFLINGPCSFKKLRTVLLMSTMFIAYTVQPTWSAIGQSAVITLVLPPGARATGLGEAFTGLANDANAIFFNPAGLGQEPLANSWKSFLDGKGPFLAVASKHKTELISSEDVWAGTAKGVLHYNGQNVGNVRHLSCRTG